MFASAFCHSRIARYVVTDNCKQAATRQRPAVVLLKSGRSSCERQCCRTVLAQLLVRRRTEPFSTSPYAASTASHTCRIMACPSRKPHPALLPTRLPTNRIMSAIRLGLGMAALSRLVVVPLVTKSFLNGSLASRVDFQSWLAMLS
jgi:hypothetical protein